MGGGYAFLCFLSLIFKHSDTKWDKKITTTKSATALTLPCSVENQKGAIAIDFCAAM